MESSNLFRQMEGAARIVQWTRNQFTVSDALDKVDLDTLGDFLADAYWAANRSRHAIEKSIQHSIVFGMYTDGKMVGFARVTTDRAVFGWISDVFIRSDYRGLGLGTWLMECLLEHPTISRLSSLGLATKDAYSWYEKFGFQRRETMLLRRD